MSAPIVAMPPSGSSSSLTEKRTSIIRPIQNTGVA